MKRSGFTMIELIFVIVILGILAAVALPKFIGVAEEAQVGKLKSYIGSVNRTAAPAMWSKSISIGSSGSVKVATLETDLNNTINPLEGILDSGGNMPHLDVTSCSDDGTAAETDANIVALTTVSTGSVGGKTYNIKCLDGNMSAAPHFYLTQGNTVVQK